MCTEGIGIAEEVGEGYGGEWIVVGVGLRVEFHHCCGVAEREALSSIDGGYWRTIEEEIMVFKVGWTVDGQIHA